MCWREQNSTEDTKPCNHHGCLKTFPDHPSSLVPRNNNYRPFSIPLVKRSFWVINSFLCSMCFFNILSFGRASQYFISSPIMLSELIQMHAGPQTPGLKDLLPSTLRYFIICGTASVQVIISICKHNSPELVHHFTIELPPSTSE